jgi:hypothetical protein
MAMTVIMTVIMVLDVVSDLKLLIICMDNWHVDKGYLIYRL